MVRMKTDNVSADRLLKDKVVKSPADKPEMSVEEIVELKSFEDALVPGTGFTWHPQK